MDGHSRLCEIALKHNLPAPDGMRLTPGQYVAHCLDLMMVELGLLQASDVRPKRNVFGDIEGGSINELIRHNFYRDGSKWQV